MISARVNRVTASKTMAITAKVKEMTGEGIDVIDFSVGEPDFMTPDHIKAAGKKAIDDNHTKYTVVNGIPELRKAIAKKLMEENGIPYSEKQICVGTGAKQPLFNAVFAVCDEGSEIMIPTPSWVSYEEIVKLSGGVPIFVPCDEKRNFELDIAAIENAISEKTRAIIINSPNNPTGAVYSRSTLEKLGELAVKHHFYIISDEVYEKLAFDVEFTSPASISEAIQEQCITINGLSKSYCMTGWRIGYAAANDEVIDAIKKIQSHTTSASNSITQYAALEAYMGDQNVVAQMTEAYKRRRDYILQRIETMKFVKACRAAGTFYVFLDISGLFGRKYKGEMISSSVQLANLLLSVAHIAVVPGDAFHADNYVRICYAVSDENIREGMNRLEKFLREVE
ncbi:MAG: pyridoxal phosphate-dependent aminotransferase [Lachnospiraceae bacterium]|nr:pyridoxal phosphate-dependent aminotransferase [Lachnospiraceae bacterium]